jgi:hypothetical protein
MLMARPVIDFGLVVLIWLVQLIIYPGFAYLSDAQMAVWHPRYTNLIGLIVGPLMLAQVVCVGYELWQRPASWAGWLSAGLVALMWASTAAQAIPLHNQIGAGLDIQTNVARLVSVNWVRTIGWTLIFGLGLWSK